MLPGTADRSSVELELGDASLGLPRLPEVAELPACITGGSSPPASEDSQVRPAAQR
jgi:hypothetical protein